MTTSMNLQFQTQTPVCYSKMQHLLSGVAIHKKPGFLYVFSVVAYSTQSKDLITVKFNFRPEEAIPPRDLRKGRHR